MAIHHCKRCGVLFEREGIKRKYLYCSHKCAKSGARRRINVETLSAFAKEGRKGVEMAKELGISRGTLREALRRLGLHGEWARRRYRKCQELTA